jgi:Tfp pilus assembly pilus retraction ATPase PilT
MNADGRSVQGDLRAFSIFDVTQSLLMGRKTARVTLVSGRRKGYVYFRDGQIVSASDDSLQQGEKAVTHIFSWVGGTFTIDFGVQAASVNIDLPTDHLLLEIARNIDEVRRDKGIEREPDEKQGKQIGDAVTDRVGEKLRARLQSVFKDIATKAEPVRERNTASAFDSHLQALLDLHGTLLFLRPGSRPRIKTRQGFATIKDRIIDAAEIHGFLQALLSEREAKEFKENKEVTSYMTSHGLGAFRINVVNEYGSPLVTITRAERTAPQLTQLIQDPGARESLQKIPHGLVVVAGPLGSGKADLVAAMIEDRMSRLDAFAFEFALGVRHVYASERGFCVRHAMPRQDELHVTLRSALDQGPDVLAFVGADPAVFPLALSAAGLHRLVLLTLESHSINDTLARLLRFGEGADQGYLTEGLSQHLRAIIDLGLPAIPGGTPEADVFLVDREAEAFLKSRDGTALRTHRLSHARVG